MADTCSTCKHLEHLWTRYIGEMCCNYRYCSRRSEQRCSLDAACQFYQRAGEYPMGGPPTGSRQIAAEWRQERRERVE